MFFTTSIKEIQAKIDKSTSERRKKDVKLLQKYRQKINRRLLSMDTPTTHLYFRPAAIHLLEMLIEELESDGFNAHLYNAFEDSGAHMYISIPPQ